MSGRFRFACVLALAITALAGAAFAVAGVAFAGAAFAASNFKSIHTNDPEMNAAKQKARETLPDFLALAKAPPPATSDFAIKIAIEDRGHTEFFWIRRFEENEGQLSGIIDNRPRVVRNVIYGQHVAFTVTDVADWLYMDDGRMKGNYTACALIRREPAPQREVFKKRYGLDCEF